VKTSSLLLAAACCAVGTRASDLPSLWAERVKCAVAVEYTTQTELERRPTIAYGTVVDSEGTIILPSAAIDLRVSPKQIRDFKVYVPGDPEGSPAEYLGRDAFTGWHFVRASASVRSRLVPVTAFAGAGEPREASLAEEVWGIGIRNKDEDFTPYILQSRVALIQALPQRTAIAQQEVAGPGLPVFDREGRFMGLGASSFGQTFLQFSGAERGGTPIMLVNVEESSAFLVAGEVLPYIGRVPKNPFGRPLAWLGAYGLEPMDREVAAFLRWFEAVDGTDPVLRAAIAHFWFVTIHPFEDGNGRVSRAIADMALARSEGSGMRFYSMSAQIEKEKQEYYRILETSQKGTLNITGWLEWFVGCFERAVIGAAGTLERIMAKAARWEQLNAMAEPNERQRKVLKALLDGGEEEFPTSKYAKLAGTSLDTALRDIRRLIEAGVLKPGASGGRSMKYTLLLPP